MTQLTKRERIDLVEEARECLERAIECVQEAFPNDEYVKAYMVDHLRICANRDHGFLSRDINMDDLIERLDDVEAEDDEWDAAAGGWESSYGRVEVDELEDGEWEEDEEVAV
jgi:hypothetical protein